MRYFVLAFNRTVRTNRANTLPFQLFETGIQYRMYQRRFTGARHTAHNDKRLERKRDRDIF